MKVHELSIKSETVSDLNLPVRGFYQLTADENGGVLPNRKTFPI